MLEIIAILSVAFLAVFVQASIAFGIALVAMPLLTSVIGLASAAPLVSAIGLTCQVFMIRRYRMHFRLSDMRDFILGSVIGVLIASLMLSDVTNPRLIETLLGVFVIGYGLFSLCKPQLPSFKKRIWAYGLGMTAGVLARIYNIGGPPGVIYADAQGWEPDAFKGNLQIYAIVNTVMVIVSRTFNAEYTSQVITYYLLAFPVILLGLYLGFTVEKRINAVIFRKMVLVFLVFIGVTLVF